MNLDELLSRINYALLNGANLKTEVSIVTEDGPECPVTDAGLHIPIRWNGGKPQCRRDLGHFVISEDKF